MRDRSQVGSRIEVRYFEGCPNQERLIARLEPLLGRESITAEVVMREIHDADEAERERFPGSPSVRVDGHDIDPGAAERTDYGMKCRVYRTADGLGGLPPDEWLLRALGAG